MDTRMERGLHGALNRGQQPGQQEPEFRLMPTAEHKCRCGSKILRWPLRFSLPSIHTLINPLPLNVGKICEYGGIIIPLIKLYHTRSCHSRLEGDSPADFADVAAIL